MVDDDDRRKLCHQDLLRRVSIPVREEERDAGSWLSGMQEDNYWAIRCHPWLSPHRKFLYPRSL